MNHEGREAARRLSSQNSPQGCCAGTRSKQSGWPFFKDHMSKRLRNSRRAASNGSTEELPLDKLSQRHYRFGLSKDYVSERGVVEESE